MMFKTKNLTVAVAALFTLLTCQKEIPPPDSFSTFPPDRPTADRLMARADTLFDALRFDSAMLLYPLAEQAYFEQKNWEKHTACRRKTAYCLWASHESAQAEALCKQILPEAAEKLGVSHPEIAQIYTVLGNIHADRRTEADFRQSLDYFQRALDISRQAFGDRTPNLAGAYERLGILHWLNDDYEAAIPFYEKALGYLDPLSRQNGVMYAKIYNNMGLAYRSMGHDRKALEYFTKARDVALYTLRQRDSKLVKYLKNMAECRLNLGDADESLHLLQEALMVENKSGDAHTKMKCFLLGNVGDCYMAKGDYTRAASQYRQCLNFWNPGNRDHLHGMTLDLQSLGNALLKQQKTDSALLCFQQAYRLVDSTFDAGSFNRAAPLSLLGQVFSEKNDTRKAEQYFTRALAIAQQTTGGHHPVVGRLKKQLSELKYQNGALDKAEKWLGSARQSFLMENIFANASPVATEINSLPDWIAVVELQGKIEMRRYEKTFDDEALRRAIACFRKAMAYSDSLKISLATQTARQDAQKQVFALAENALSCLWQLWQHDPRPEYLHDVFLFMEKSKGASMLASAHLSQAEKFAGVPSEWLEREQQLKASLNAYQSALINVEINSGSGANSKMGIFQNRFFDAKRTLDSFLVCLERQFPEYYRLKYDRTTADLTALRQFAAQNNTQLVEFFWGKEALYGFYISPDSVFWQKITDLNNLNSAPPKEGKITGVVQGDSAFKTTFLRLLASLSNKNRQETSPDRFFADAYFLCQKLLPGRVISNTRPIIIVPDGLLCYLPFEALLTLPHQGNFANAPYLLRSHSVQYAWMATLLTLPEPTQPTQGGLMHIVPFAQSARDGLAALPNSLRDVPVGVGSEVLEGATATSTAFLKKAPQHSALHLSTHASAGRCCQPGIEFHDRTLALPEIYAHRFRASIVSLSACETGAGEVAEGEGILSLARAFAFAGAQSLVSSLWQVNERSTAELFSTFYKNLENGLSKAEALRQSKLSYLASPEPDARKTPFHWAAFTLTGANGQVNLIHSTHSSRRNWFPLAFAASLFTLLIGQFYFWNTGKITPDAPEGA